MLFGNIFYAQFTNIQLFEVQFFALRQDFNSSFEVYLVFVEAAWLRSVCKSTFNPDCELPSRLGVAYVFGEGVENLYKAKFFCKIAAVVFDSRSEQEGFTFTVFNCLDLLVDHSETFFSFKTAFDLVFVLLFIPLLALFIKLSYKMCSYFMV